MDRWKILQSHTVLQDSWIHVSASKVQTSDGVILDPFYRIHPKDWVIVLGQDMEGKWILVKQYRFGADDFFWEFPAGTMEEGEDPLGTAQREMLEETGFGAGDWSWLCTHYVNPANATNRFHAFWAQNLQKIQEPQWDHGEEMEVHLLEDEEFKRLLDQGEFANPHHLCAYFKWLRNLK